MSLLLMYLIIFGVFIFLLLTVFFLPLTRFSIGDIFNWNDWDSNYNFTPTLISILMLILLFLFSVNFAVYEIEDISCLILIIFLIFGR